MPLKSRMSIEARRRQAVKRSREYYNKNKKVLRVRSAMRMRAFRHNNPEYRKEELKRNAGRIAQLRTNPKYREEEYKRAALRRAANKCYAAARAWLQLIDEHIPMPTA